MIAQLQLQIQQYKNLKNCFKIFGNCHNPKRLIKTGTLCPPRRQQSLKNEKVFMLPEIEKSEINQTEEEV